MHNVVIYYYLNITFKFPYIPYHKYSKGFRAKICSEKT